MRKLKTAFAALAAAILLSCGPTDLRRVVEDLVIENATIYAAGYVTGAIGDTPCYWVNGIKTDLPIQDSATYTGRAFDIVSDGPDIYIAGYSIDSIANRHAHYWKNASRNDLSTGFSEARALCVWNDVLYVGGVDNNLPVYWTTDPATPPVTLDSPNGAIYAVFADQDGVYFSGSTNPSGSQNACYWNAQTGVRTDLAGTSGTAYSIWRGDAFFAAGVSSGSPYLWAGQGNISLPGGSGYGLSIVMHEGQAFVGGFYWSGGVQIPCYWIYSERTDLFTDAGQNAVVSSIAVFAGRVFAAGMHHTATGDVPCIWRDGERIDLPGGYGEALSIYVE